MRNYYLKSYLLVGLLFVMQMGFAQQKLNDSPNGGVIQSYLDKNKDKHNLTDNDILDLYVTDEYLSKKSKTIHVYVNQNYQGISIYNAISSVSVKDNMVTYFSNKFLNNINSRINTTTPSINAETAIQKVAEHFKLGAPANLERLSSEGNKAVFSNGNVSQVDIPVNLVFSITSEGELKLAWDLSVYAKDGQNWWSVRVDALSGEIVDVSNWVVSCNFGDGNHENHEAHESKVVEEETFNLFKSNSLMVNDGSQYNVYALPSESPNHSGRTSLSEPANEDASPFGWHDTNGAAGAEYTITRGNNVYAYDDVAAADTPGGSPDAGSSLNFDYPVDFALEPGNYQEASLTNLFYINNVMHDIWYQYGFDEVSGNFQQNNYGKGGNGNDYVHAQGQDGGGLNNANFGTPGDGGAPRMQMYLWNAPAINNIVTVNSGSAMGGYQAANPGTGAGNNISPIGSNTVTADLVLVNDGSVAPTEGCNAISADLTGKIALIRRGNCPFVDKIQNAQDAGAEAVIMINHNNPDNDPTYTEYVNMAGETTPAFTIPSVFINYADGEILLAAMQNETVNVTLKGFAEFVDGSLDNVIVAHEYGHGISNRLTGGPAAASCLQNDEQMGEGWSDWFALMITMKEGDLAETGRGIATYSNGDPVDGLGIRPAQYSTDFSVNNYTYGATNDHTLLGQDADGNDVYWNEIAHNIGFVWATMLWDLTWAYVDKYGFDVDVYNGTGGNNKVMHLVIEGLKNQGCSPDFIDGRDGILAADRSMFNGEDQCLIWEVFAARGLGVNAYEGPVFGGGMEDQVEDFTTPPDTDPTLANCTNLSVEGFDVSNDYKIYPNPANSSVFVKTSKNFGEVVLTLTDINGRQVMSSKVDLFGEVQIDINKLQSGLYILNIKGQSIDINEKIIKK